MKTFAIALCLYPMALTEVWAQGTIRFSTKVDSQVDAPVTWPDGRGIGLLFTNLHAQLFVINGGYATPLTPGSTFSGGKQNLVDGRYVVEPDELVYVPGVLPGEQVTVVLRVWTGPDWESAWITKVARESLPFTVTVGGATQDGQVLPPALLAGLQGFTVGPLSPPSHWTIYLGGAVVGDDGVFRVRVISSYFPTYVLESSIDFNSWNPVLTNSFNPIDLEIPFSPANDQPAFFRLRTF